MSRENWVALWDEAEASGLWCAAWSRSVEGLSAKQASWQPMPGRHSIWQIVNHLTFWREYVAKRTLTGTKLPDEEINRRNFEAPSEITEAAWQKACKRFAESHATLRSALANPECKLESLYYLLPHDNYHVGQIMYLRAMQGLEPIE